MRKPESVVRAGAGGDLPPNSWEAGIKTAPEMRMLALAKDALTTGHLPEVADLLKQRFKALEMAVDQKDGALTGHSKLGAASDGLASLAEKEAAVQQAILQHRLNEAVKRKVGTKSHNDGGRNDGSRSPPVLRWNIRAKKHTRSSPARARGGKPMHRLSTRQRRTALWKTTQPSP